MNHLGNNSEFLQTFSPYQFLKDDQNKLDTLLNRIELAEFLNLLFTASPPDFETVCNCLKNRHQMNSNYAPLMRAFVVDSASLMNLFLAMEMTNYGDYIPALAARLGFENLDIEEAKNQLWHYVYGNNGNGSNLKTLFDELYILDEGFSNCGTTTTDFLNKLYTDQPNKLIELFVVIPEIRDIFYNQNKQTDFTCLSSLIHDDMAILMSNNYPEISWNKLIDAFGTNTILSYFVNNQNSYFMNQAVLYNKSILTNTQQNQNLYGGNYGGLENYFTYIRNYFGQGLYDQITAGFMQQSSVYTDSLRLEEWHMYGSSRIGIYQTNKAMAQRTVRIENGVTTQLSNTHIEQLSLSRFYTERGAKRYELTNHLGNVLTVVTDKKLPVCSGTSVSYFIADVVSATDYSPFGAPLAGRTWQGSEYRYGFNGKENDDETYGGGNAYDFGARIYDARNGRFFSKDGYEKVYPDLSPYQMSGNNPIYFIDEQGNYYYAYSRKNKRLTKAALKLVFGDNNGFSFDGDKLVYHGQSHLNDPRKDYLLHLLLDEIVNSANNHINLKSGGEVTGAEKEFPFFSDDSRTLSGITPDMGDGTGHKIDGETTVSVINNSGQIQTTIFIGGYSLWIGSEDANGVYTPELDVNGNEFMRSPEMLLWHGIGHALTNQYFKDGYGKTMDPVVRANSLRRTVGFENFITNIINNNKIPARSGTSHGNTKIPNSSGSDNHYTNDCNEKIDNYDTRPATEEEKKYESG